MATTRMLQLIPARWKGVSFLVSKEMLTQIGQKYIIHDYPNTNLRYIEPHGKVPFQSEITITFSGITFKDDFLNFKRAMEDPSPGTLYLPTLGVFTNMVALPTSASSDHGSYGEITFTVQFSETVAQPSPQTADAGQQDVFNSGSTALSAISTSFENKYVQPGTVNNFLTVISDITNIVGAYQKVTGAVQLASLVALNLSRIISKPSSIANFIFNPINGIIALANAAINPSTAYSGYKSLATSGNNLSSVMHDIQSNFVPVLTGTPPAIVINSNIPAWAGTTFEQIQRNNNRYATVNSFRLAGLIGMCQQAGIQSFTTVQQVQSVINDINNYFNMLIENDSTNIIIPDVKTEMETLKNNTISTLYSIQQNVFNTMTITLEKPIAPRELIYELYGEFIQNSDDLDNFTSIILNLNKSQPAHLFTGQVTILQS